MTEDQQKTGIDRGTYPGSGMYRYSVLVHDVDYPVHGTSEVLRRWHIPRIPRIPQLRRFLSLVDLLVACQGA